MWENVQVPRGFKSTPRAFKSLVSEAANIGGGHDQAPPGFEQAPAFVKASDGVGDMLDHVAHSDRVKGRLLDGHGLEIADLQVHAIFLFAGLNRRSIEIDS